MKHISGVNPFLDAKSNNEKQGLTVNASRYPTPSPRNDRNVPHSENESFLADEDYLEEPKDSTGYHKTILGTTHGKNACATALAVPPLPHPGECCASRSGRFM
jgi:hypothetical protein